MSENYYDILGVKKDASDEELKAAYRKRSRETHPDLHPGDKQKEEEFKKVSEAYSVLSDKDKRARYDQFGSAEGMGSFGPGGFDPFKFFREHSGFGADFADMFGGFGHHKRSNRTDQNAPKNGRNINIGFQISFEEAIYGVTREFDIKFNERCDHCHGTGSDDGKSGTCPTCGGTGMFVQRSQFSINATTCPTCHGIGTVVTKPCHVCGGSGQAPKAHHININIPRGVSTGTRLKVSGEGESGVNGGSSGDLYINLTVDDNNLYHRDGNDLYMEMNISPIFAMLGGKMTIQTPWGQHEINVTTTLSTGSRLKIDGCGVRSASGNGDLYIITNIETPRNLSQKQKDLISQLSVTFSEKNLPECENSIKEQKEYYHKNKDKMK